MNIIVSQHAAERLTKRMKVAASQHAKQAADAWAKGERQDASLHLLKHYLHHINPMNHADIEHTGRSTNFQASFEYIHYAGWLYIFREKTKEAYILVTVYPQDATRTPSRTAMPASWGVSGGAEAPLSVGGEKPKSPVHCVQDSD